MKTKNIIILSTAAFLTVAISSTALILTGMEARKEAQKKPDDENSYVELEPWNPDKENTYEGGIVYQDDGKKFGSESGPPLTETIANGILYDVRKLIMEEKFIEAESLLMNSIESYNLEETGAFDKLIQPMRNSIPGLAQIDFLTEHEQLDIVNNIVKSLPDPFAFLYGVLQINPSDRVGYFIDENSINPFEGKISTLNSVNRIRNKSDFYPEIEYGYELSFSMNEYEMKAIILNDGGKYLLQRIDVLTDNHPYRTVKNWRDALDEYESENMPNDIPVEGINTEEGGDVNGENSEETSVP